MALTEAPTGRLAGMHEEYAADVSFPRPQMASTTVEDNIMTLETFNIPSPESGVPSDSTTSLDRRVSSSETDSLSSSSEGFSSLVSPGDFMNNYEDIPPRMLRVPLPFSQATELEWRIFGDFFDADRYQCFDNSNNLSCYHFLRLWSLWLQRPELQKASSHPHSFDNLPPIRTFDHLPSLRDDRIAESLNERTVTDRTVTAGDLKEDICNFQGLSWQKLGTNSAWVRYLDP